MHHLLHLHGYDDDIKETGRYVSTKKELNEEQKKILDIKLHEIRKKITLNPRILCTYFIPDLYKEGGKYEEYIGNIKKIDEYNKQIIFEDNRKIYISDIIKLEICEN